MMAKLKPAITVAEADLALARSIEALKTARTMIRGARPNWTAAGEFMSAAHDMICDTYTPIIDSQVASWQTMREAADD